MRLQEKVRGGRPLLYQPNVLIEVGRIAAGLASARTLTYAALADMIDPNRDPAFNYLGTSAKVIAAEEALRAGHAMLNFMGAEGYDERHPWGRFMRDVSAYVAGQGAQDKNLMQVAEHAIHQVEMARLRAG